MIVLSGKDKGKTGEVIVSMPTTEQVIVEGVNVQTHHQKNRRTRSQGQIIEKSGAIHVSNVALLEGKKPVRVGYKTEGEGAEAKKVRISRKTGKTI